MSLTKLFNFKYLKQNVKKSKGLLTLLTLIVPVLTALVLLSTNNISYSDVIEENVLSSINILGMYIVPFILSVILMGYIYKKNSVDFINSMPMNRKTIYFTNFIGGVVIIFFIQILVLLTELVCSQLFQNVYIATAMIWDAFLIMLISYIFTYSACMLAQTVSGNVLTQIAVTALILFLVPFIHFAFTNVGMYEETQWEIECDERVTLLDESMYYNYTMPFNLLFSVTLNGGSLYNEASMIKMVVISIVYLIIGLILFDKRKMENVGTSFESLKAHYFVKALTMIPMVFFCYMTELNGISLGIAITLMAVYYVIYDFIVSKKVKLRYTIGGFIITIAAICLIYKGGTKITNTGEPKYISINDVKAISLNRDFMLVGPDNRSSLLEIMVDNPEMIKEVISNSYSRNSYYTEEYNDFLYEYQYATIKLKLKTGKEIYSRVFIEPKVYNRFEKEVKTNPKYAECLKFDKIVIIAGKFLSEEDTNKIKQVLEARNYNVEEPEFKTDLERFSLYVYDNHNLKSINIEMGLTKETFEIITRNYNERSYESLKNNDEPDNYRNCHIYKVSKNGDIVDKDDISIAFNSKVKKYILDHYNDACDMNKDVYFLRTYGNSRVNFFTNITPELDEIIMEDMLYNQSEWQSQWDEKYLYEDDVVEVPQV